jgi:hypothetical protein
MIGKEMFMKLTAILVLALATGGCESRVDSNAQSAKDYFNTAADACLSATKNVEMAADLEPVTAKGKRSLRGLQEYAKGACRRSDEAFNEADNAERR